jgi:hypothetical protein
MGISIKNSFKLLEYNEIELKNSEDDLTLEDYDSSKVSPTP